MDKLCPLAQELSDTKDELICTLRELIDLRYANEQIQKQLEELKNEKTTSSSPESHG